MDEGHKAPVGTWKTEHLHRNGSRDGWKCNVDADRSCDDSLSDGGTCLHPGVRDRVDRRDAGHEHPDRYAIHSQRARFRKNKPWTSWSCRHGERAIWPLSRLADWGWIVSLDIRTFNK